MARLENRIAVAPCGVSIHAVVPEFSAATR
jgi:hypothetical protein